MACTLGTHQMDLYSCKCLQGGATAVHRIPKQKVEHSLAMLERMSHMTCICMTGPQWVHLKG